MIRWGSSSYRPSNGQRQGINPPARQNMLAPLEDRMPGGLVWGSAIVNVQKEEDTPSVSPSPTPSVTMTPTASAPAPSPSTTPTPTPTPSVAPAPSASYITSSGNTTSAGSHTYTQIPYGGAGLVVVGVSYKSNGSDLTTITLGGTSMTQYSEYNRDETGTGDGRTISMFGVLRLTGGTNADLVVNSTGTITGTAVGVWNLSNVTNDVPYITTGGTAFQNNVFRSSISVDLTTLTGESVGIPIVAQGENDGASTWTNATERYEQTTGTGADFTQSGTASRLLTNSFPNSVEKPTTISVAVWK